LHLRLQLEEPNACVILNDLDRRAHEGHQRRVVDAENGILKPLVALKVAYHHPAFPRRVTVDAERVGLVLVMIYEVPDDPRSCCASRYFGTAKSP
jgi:hypothetical protein